jgi:hypothetical protein
MKQVENKIEGILMDEIDKVKIDILRDALKDTTDTIRALDRKIVFLVSYNAVFQGFIVTIFLKYEEVVKLLSASYQYFYIFLGILGVIWLFIFIRVMMGIAPKSNPIEVFESKDDRSFSNNVFFVLTSGENSLKLGDLTQNLNKIDTLEKINKLLYKELGKTSYIRDIKLKSVSSSVHKSWILTFIFIIMVTGFSLHNLTIHDKKSNNNITK